MNIYGGISWLVFFLLSAILLIFRKKLADRVMDRSKLVFNEQAKLAATALNNISVALIVGGFLLPIFQGRSEFSNEWTKSSALTIWAWMFGFALHILAQFILSKMKE